MKRSTLSKGSLQTLVDGCLRGMARMELHSQARCLMYDRKHNPEIARELEKQLDPSIVALADLTQE